MLCIRVQMTRVQMVLDWVCPGGILPTASVAVVAQVNAPTIPISLPHHWSANNGNPALTSQPATERTKLLELLTKRDDIYDNMQDASTIYRCYNDARM